MILQKNNYYNIFMEQINLDKSKEIESEGAVSERSGEALDLVREKVSRLNLPKNMQIEIQSALSNLMEQDPKDALSKLESAMKELDILSGHKERLYKAVMENEPDDVIEDIMKESMLIIKKIRDIIHVYVGPVQ